jgi:hypothetical protein
VLYMMIDTYLSTMVRIRFYLITYMLECVDREVSLPWIMHTSRSEHLLFTPKDPHAKVNRGPLLSFISMATQSKRRKTRHIVLRALDPTQ